MSDLTLNKNLLSSKRGDAVRSVARTLTLTTLRGLDGSRKGEVVRFLADARVVHLIDLTRAELRGADLAGVDLTNANLENVNVRGTRGLPH